MRPRHRANSGLRLRMNPEADWQAHRQPQGLNNACPGVPLPLLPLCGAVDLSTCCPPADLGLPGLWGGLLLQSTPGLALSGHSITMSTTTRVCF